MWSKNHKKLTADEKEYLAAVKALPCSVCDAPGPSSAHHIRQELHYITVALCWECHQGKNGWHDSKAMWRIKKMDELDALNVTQSRIRK